MPADLVDVVLETLAPGATFSEVVRVPWGRAGLLRANEVGGRLAAVSGRTGLRPGTTLRVSGVAARELRDRPAVDLRFGGC